MAILVKLLRGDQVIKMDEHLLVFFQRLLDHIALNPFFALVAEGQPRVALPPPLPTVISELWVEKGTEKGTL